MVEILISKVNQVEKMEAQGTHVLVRKLYGSRAVKTGVALPIKRALVERRISIKLERIGRRKPYDISVAAAKKSSPRINIMPYIEGRTLRSVPASEWPKPKQLRNLGMFIAEVERGIGPGIFLGLMLTSQKLGRIIRAYKTGSSALGRGVYFSLGDATLANTLLTSKGICLLDFEFGHMSNGGFDVAMLAAEIHQLIKQGAPLGYARSALLQGYTSGGGSLPAVLVWRNRLLKYQSARKFNGGV